MNEIRTESKALPGWDERCNVLYVAKVTFRYHRKRQRLFDLLDKGTKAVTVILGVSLLGDALKLHVPLVASTISSLGLLALVFGYGERKQTHKELAEAAMQLTARIEEIPAAKVNPTLAGQWAAELSRLNTREPPTLKTLVVLCEHEESTANGHPANVPLPRWYKRVLADWVP